MIKMVSIPNEQQSARMDQAITGARLAIANAWLEEARKRVDHCIATLELNPAAVGSDKEARTSQYLLSEAEYYFDVSGSKTGVEAVKEEYKKLEDAGVPLLQGDDLHMLIMDRHSQMKARAKRLGFTALAADLNKFIGWHKADLAGKPRDADPPEDKSNTLIFTGQEAMAMALQDVYEGKYSGPRAQTLIEAALLCASPLGLEGEWSQMIDDARKAYEKNKAKIMDMERR